MVKEIRTVVNAGGVPVLEIIKENDTLVIHEADDMDRQIQFPVSEIPALIRHLDSLQ
jgi:hypothetical protein